MNDRKKPGKPASEEEAPHAEEMRKMVREDIEEQRHLLEKLRRKMN